ncbi:branched-chain amino acid ABC transporter permease [Moorella sulfitireducens]|uniref:branched-chain amino acid ABC transporter permease n=1 Tax=Neomoorella sulfitireducens TaxID=2972948 RepID=UPI0021AC5540|nr:branched-chain amino acid ABC transporter permease [Moorella sulfitireducens]
MIKEKKNTLTWTQLEFRLALIIFVALACVPLIIKQPYLIHIFIMALLYAYVAQCWNLLGGVAGQFSIGHIMYFGVGAYAAIFLFTKMSISPWIGMVFAGIMAAILGLFVSFLGLRYGLKGDYYALFTLALSQMLKLIVTNIKTLGGAMGIYIPLKGFSLVNMQFRTKIAYFYIALVMVVVITFIVYRIITTRIGMYFVALRENESAAEALGVDTTRYKTIATIISAVFTGMGGTLFAMYTMYIDPEITFGLGPNFEFILMAIIGGKGSLLGPVVGSLILKPLAEFTRAIFGGGRPGVFLMIYGALLATVILFLPNGLMGLLQRSYRQLSVSKQKVINQGIQEIDTTR